jgi:Pyridoxamine 5'-phosphate oxidase
MGKRFNLIDDKIKAFIEEQKVFFVGTASHDGRINVSPKGADTFRVLNKNRVIWLNLTGSGNETAAHLAEMDRMTIMFCAFEGKPLILRLYGQAKIFNKGHQEFEEYINLFADFPGSRQIVDMHVELVQTSCGMAVPLMDFKADREELNKWADKKGLEKLQQYWQEKNTVSIDGKSIDIKELAS